MRDPYSVLGIKPDATDDEVKAAYRNLARKYHPDNYQDDNPLKELAKEKMQEINSAYDEIQRMRMGAGGTSGGANNNNGSTGGTNNNGGGTNSGTNNNGGSGNSVYTTVRQKIQQGDLVGAEGLLMSVGDYDRTAEWHFLMAVCLMQRNRPNDAMRELEIACNMDPANMEYQKAKEMFNRRAGNYGSNAYYGPQNVPYQRSQTDQACDCCANLICMDCLCECLGGDLIRCI